MSRPTNRPIDRPTDRPIDRPTDRLLHRSIDRSTHQSVPLSPLQSNILKFCIVGRPPWHRPLQSKILKSRIQEPHKATDCWIERVESDPNWIQLGFKLARLGSGTGSGYFQKTREGEVRNSLPRWSAVTPQWTILNLFLTSTRTLQLNRC